MRDHRVNHVLMSVHGLREQTIGDRRCLARPLGETELLVVREDHRRRVWCTRLRPWFDHERGQLAYGARPEPAGFKMKWEEAGRVVQGCCFTARGDLAPAEAACQGLKALVPGEDRYTRQLAAMCGLLGEVRGLPRQPRPPMPEVFVCRTGTTVSSCSLDRLVDEVLAGRRPLPARRGSEPLPASGPERATLVRADLIEALVIPADQPTELTSRVSGRLVHLGGIHADVAEVVFAIEADDGRLVQHRAEALLGDVDYRLSLGERVVAGELVAAATRFFYYVHHSVLEGPVGPEDLESALVIEEQRGPGLDLRPGACRIAEADLLEAAEDGGALRVNLWANHRVWDPARTPAGRAAMVDTRPQSTRRLAGGLERVAA